MGKNQKAIATIWKAQDATGTLKNHVKIAGIDVTGLAGWNPDGIMSWPGKIKIAGDGADGIRDGYTELRFMPPSKPRTEELAVINKLNATLEPGRKVIIPIVVYTTHKETDETIYLDGENAMVYDSDAADGKPLMG